MFRLFRAYPFQFFETHRPFFIGQAVGVCYVHIIPKFGINKANGICTLINNLGSL